MDAHTCTVLMKPMIALLALFSVACGGRESSGQPTGPTGPTGPTVPTEQADGGQWSQRAPLIEPNSELAFADLNGKVYLMGGYPASRQTARTVQVYDTASDRWSSVRRSRSPTTTGWLAASTAGST